MIPPTTECYKLPNRPLGLSVSCKNLRIFISKDDTIVHNYFCGKLQILLSHGSPTLDKICQKKTSLATSLRLGRCEFKISLGVPW